MKAAMLKLTDNAYNDWLAGYATGMAAIPSRPRGGNVWPVLAGGIWAFANAWTGYRQSMRTGVDKISTSITDEYYLQMALSRAKDPLAYAKSEPTVSGNLLFSTEGRNRVKKPHFIVTQAPLYQRISIGPNLSLLDDKDGAPARPY